MRGESGPNVDPGQRRVTGVLIHWTGPREIRMADATLQFLGAAGTVTGSRYLVDAGGCRVLVDGGLFQGYKQLRERNRAPFPVPPETIDAVVLTHAHLD